MGFSPRAMHVGNLSNVSVRLRYMLIGRVRCWGIRLVRYLPIETDLKHEIVPGKICPTRSFFQHVKEKLALIEAYWACECRVNNGAWRSWSASQRKHLKFEIQLLGVFDWRRSAAEPRWPTAFKHVAIALHNLFEEFDSDYLEESRWI